MNSLSVKGRERSLRLKMLPSWQNKMNNYNEATDVLQSDSTLNRYRPLSAESGPDGRLVPAVGTNQIAGFENTARSRTEKNNDYHLEGSSL